MRKLTVMLATVVALLLTASVATAAAPPKLLGTVGPGFTITLKTPSGKTAKLAKKGVYSISVVDRSSIHNFVLEGPGVEREITTVPGTGAKTVKVTLRAGKYKFYCRPHESSMFGYLTVS
jgi:plastocyanin